MDTMCGRWTEDVLLDHLQDRLPEPLRREIAAHAGTCRSCEALLRELGPIAEVSGPEALVPSTRTTEAVLEVIRGESARRSTASRRATTRRLRIRRLASRSGVGLRYAAILAAGVLFAILLGYAGVRFAERPSLPRETPRTVQLPVPPVEPGPALLPPPSERPRDLPLPPPPLPRIEPPLSTPDPTPAPPAPRREPPRPTTIVEVPPASLPAEFARVARFTGRAERGGAILRRGDILLAGQEIACRSGTLLLELPDESLVVVRGGSTFTAEVEAARVTLHLAAGELACSVQKRAERRFAVETPHGAAVVRGTMFSVRTQAGGAAVVVSHGRVEVAGPGGSVAVAAGERTQIAKNAAPSKPESVAADRHLAWAVDAGLRVIGPIWIAAGAADLQAPMTRGRQEGSLSQEAILAAVDSRSLKTWSGRSLQPDREEGGWAAVTIDVPEDGVWHLWGRLFSPGSGSQIFRQDDEPRDNDPNSFFVSIDGGRELVFGNFKVDPETRLSGYRRWLWAGDGGVEVGKPSPLKLGRLAKGRHTIRIRNRDAVETAALRLAPRLDVLCLTADPDYRPRDEDYRKP